MLRPSGFSHRWQRRRLVARPPALWKQIENDKMLTLPTGVGATKVRIIRTGCRAPIGHVSVRQAKRLSDFHVVAKRFLKDHPVCRKERCMWRAVQVHHSRGRLGSLLTDARFFVEICKLHHRWIHDNMDAARKEGLLCQLGE